MNLKKKLKAFFTFKRRRDGGFTLVELIVVIAILAILAGVGTAGYAGYIKNANKNADKVLVGNIMRAIETGAYSTMFTPPEPLAVGVTTYPVGFVSLSKDGCTVLTSASTEKEVSGDCVFETKEVTYVEPKNTILRCTSDSSHTGVGTTYTLKTETVTYCTTHSVSQPQVLAAANSNTYATGYTYKKNISCYIGHKTNVTGYLTIPAGALFVEDVNDLYQPSANDLCLKAANPGLNVSADPATDGVLYDAVNAAFGDEDPKLKYDGWVTDEGASFATFYTYAPQVFDSVANQSELLISVVNDPTLNNTAQTLLGVNLNSYLTKGKYESSADLLDSFANFVGEKMTPAEWDEVWKTAGTTSDEYDFRLPSLGAKNDYIWAARMAYNSSFASYCSACNIPDTYTDLIVNYGEDELGGALHIPSVVNADAFSKSGEGSLKQSFIDTDATNGEAMFEKCNALFNSYVNSSVAAENGKVFYNTVETVKQTGSVAMDPNNGYEDYFAYYKSYLDEMANLYSAAQTAADDGILIVVSMENNTVKCDVSPSAANPRKD